MNLTLSREIEERIADQVRSGRFPTPEAVVEAAVADLAEPMDPTLDAEDLAAIAEADAEIDRGEGLSIEAVRAMLSARIAKP